MDLDNLVAAEKAIGYAFRDRTMLEHALTHASTADSRIQSNERLEFLGDAILGMVVCERLFTRFEDLLEGELTKIKSTVVSRRTCAELAEAMGLDQVLYLGKGMSNRKRLPGSVMAAVYESLVGAIYLDGGLDAARDFILRDLEALMEQAAASGHQHNFKSVLQQTAQQLLGAMPQYLVMEEKGPDHAKHFAVCVEIGARRFPACWGASKKEAEQDAALEALFVLGVAHRRRDGEVLVTAIDEATPPPPLPVAAAPEYDEEPEPRCYDPDAMYDEDVA